MKAIYLVRNAVVNLKNSMIAIELNYSRLEGEGFRKRVDSKSTLLIFLSCRHSCGSRNPVVFGFLDSGFHRNDNSDALSFKCSWSASLQSERKIRERSADHFADLASPQGEGFLPSPKGTLKESIGSDLPTPIDNGWRERDGEIVTRKNSFKEAVLLDFSSGD